MVTRCLIFSQQVDSNGEILKSLARINILAIVQKNVLLKFDLEDPKLENCTMFILQLQKKMEIKKKNMLSEYQLKIADLYNILIANVKKLVPNFFDEEKYVLHYETCNFTSKLD